MAWQHFVDDAIVDLYPASGHGAASCGWTHVPGANPDWFYTSWPTEDLGNPTIEQPRVEARARELEGVRPSDVKAEAQYRLELVATGDNAEVDEFLFDYMVGKRLDGGTLNATEQLEWDRIRAWHQQGVGVYRDMKNILAMEPIPADYQDDSYWPNSPPRI